MSYPPPSGGFPMYGPPPVPGGGSQYPAPGGPPLGFDSYASQPSYVGATPGVSVCSFYLPGYYVISHSVSFTRTVIKF